MIVISRSPVRESITAAGGAAPSRLAYSPCASRSRRAPLSAIQRTSWPCHQEARSPWPWVTPVSKLVRIDPSWPSTCASVRSWPTTTTSPDAMTAIPEWIHAVASWVDLVPSHWFHGSVHTYSGPPSARSTVSPLVVVIPALPPSADAAARSRDALGDLVVRVEDVLLGRALVEVAVALGRVVEAIGVALTALAIWTRSCRIAMHQLPVVPHHRALAGREARATSPSRARGASTALRSWRPRRRRRGRR